MTIRSLSVVVALLVTSAWGRPYTPVGVKRGNAASSVAPAFRFATPAGTGMGLVCAGTTPTGSKGETITLAARASLRSCMKGNETTGIANGDMVILTANQYAVQPGGDGTGSLGISVWPTATTNSLTGPSALSAAPWTSFGDFSPTITADDAVAPDGTTTADRFQFAATSAAQRTIRYQDTGCPTGTTSASCYFRGKSGSGTTDLCLSAVNGAGWGCAKTAGVLGCTFVSTSWTRCVVEALNVTTSGVNTLFAFGNQSLVNGGTARNAADVEVWGCQCEPGQKVSPYIPDGTRNAELVTVSLGGGSTVSFGGTVVLANTNVVDDMVVASVSTDVTHEVVLITQGAKAKCDFNNGGAHNLLYSLTDLFSSSSGTAACTYAPTSRVDCLGEYCKPLAGAVTIATGAATLRIGSQTDGGTVGGTIKDVCADFSSPTPLCRPANASTVTCPFTGTEAQTAALIGDSVMVGANEAKVIDVVRDGLCLSSRGASSFAVSGAQIDSGANNCTLQYTTSVQGHAYRAVLTNCGINNILAGESAAVAWGKMQTFLNTVVADGFPLVVGNLTPCHGYPTCDDAKVVAFNASEATWCSTHPTATCIDNFSLLAESDYYYPTAPTGYLGSRCVPSTDGLHPNNYGTNKLGAAFATATP